MSAPRGYANVALLQPILIIGAGPAGCAAARLLSSWGHAVLVVARPIDESRALAESIPPSADRVLAALGMLSAVQGAGFHPWSGNLVWWGRAEPRVETFAPGAYGYQVNRAAFDRCLRQLAIDSGAQLRHGYVRGVDLSKPSPAIVIDAQGRHERVSGSFVLDCSGRAGVLARPDLRRTTSRHRTIAIVGTWQAPGWNDESSDRHTWVASYGDGWAWSVSTDAQTRYFTVMVDPRRTDLLRGTSSREIYLRELAKVEPFTAALATATLRDGPWGADASPYDAHRYSDEHFLLVGDAGSFIDPLSSFGVKKALASGWLAAIVTHTVLTRPEMRDHALAFFDHRERDVYAASSRQAAAFASAAADSSQPFWLARASSMDDAHEFSEVDVSALARDAGVLAAFADLRTRTDVRLRAAHLDMAPRPAVRGREIVLEEQLVLPDAPQGVRYVRGVDLLMLLRTAATAQDVGEICDSIVRAQPGVAVPDILGALSWLIARGALVHDPARHAGRAGLSQPPDAGQPGGPRSKSGYRFAFKTPCARNKAHVMKRSIGAWLFILLAVSALKTLAAQEPPAQGAKPKPGAGSDEGIPITNKTVTTVCGDCHETDAKGRMSRISYRRTTPEGWQETIRRMATLHKVDLDPAAAREVVKYLADNHGLAPEEAKPGAFEVERRLIDYRYTANADTATTCSHCHSIGRVILQRRTGEEWDLLLAMHRGFYPLIDGQAFRRFGPPSREPGPDGRPPDNRHPMDKALGHLKPTFPLTTAEWAAWSATMRSPRLEGSGHCQGMKLAKGRSMAV